MNKILMTLPESSRLPFAQLRQAADWAEEAALVEFSNGRTTDYIIAQNNASIRGKGGEVYLETGE